MRMRLHIKRIYETWSSADGYRVLVDRLWPRGVKKESAHVDEWLKEVAPSQELRKWFNHEPEKWELFCERYSKELQTSPSFERLKDLMNKYETLTLLYSARDNQHNQAILLQMRLQPPGA